MPALTRPHGAAKDDYAIFSDLADRLGVGKDFTEGRTAMEWLRHLYDEWRDSLASRHRDWPVPGFDEFWANDGLELPVATRRRSRIADYRGDPEGHPLSTPTGKIEIFSSTIDGYGYPDCLATPCGLSLTSGSARPGLSVSVCSWWPTSRRRGCTASWTSARIVSQLRSPDGKRCGCTLQTRRLAVCAAGTSCGSSTTGVPAWRGWLSTTPFGLGWRSCPPGPWYDPDPADPGFCRHGNPNVLTADLPSSRPSSRGARAAGACRDRGVPGCAAGATINRPPETV